MTTPRLNIAGLSFEPPEGWRMNTLVMTAAPEAPPAPAMRAAVKAPEPFLRSVVVNLEPVAEGVSATAHAQALRRRLADAGLDVRPVSGPEVRDVAGGVPAVFSEHTLAGPEGERLRQLQAVFVKGQVAVQAVATHLDGPLFEGARDELTKLLASFSFE
jgi:hypothetical protein